MIFTNDAEAQLIFNKFKEAWERFTHERYGSDEHFEAKCDYREYAVDLALWLMSADKTVPFVVSSDLPAGYECPNCGTRYYLDKEARCPRCTALPTPSLTTQAVDELLEDDAIAEANRITDAWPDDAPIDEETLMAEYAKKQEKDHAELLAQEAAWTTPATEEEINSQTGNSCDLVDNCSYRDDDDEGFDEDAYFGDEEYEEENEPSDDGSNHASRDPLSGKCYCPYCNCECAPDFCNGCHSQLTTPAIDTEMRSESSDDIPW